MVIIDWIKKGLLISFLLFGLSVKAADLGVIEISLKYSATLEFNKYISKVIFGYNPAKKDASNSNGPNSGEQFEYYNYTIAGKVLVIHASAMNTSQTTVTVILNDNTTYSGIIRYKEEPSKYYYSYTSGQNVVPIKHDNKPVIPKVEKLSPEQRLQRLLEDKNIYSYVEVKSKVYFIITNIKNDNDNTYLKLMIVNESKKDYQIDNISFIKIMEVEGAFQSKDVITSEYIDVKHSVYPKENKVTANSSSKLGFVLPVFSTDGNGKMIIQVLEKEGNRNVDIEILGKEFLKVGSF